MVAVASQRTLPPERVVEVCRALEPNLRVSACGSLAEALAMSVQDPFVVLTGSLYLVGEAMELLRLSEAPSGERGLNDWGGTGAPPASLPASPGKGP